MITKRFITVSTAFEGFHRYVYAPEIVSYLRDVHRHIFNVNVKIQVFHNDRELEFIIVKHRLDNILKSLPLRDKDLKAKMSCEMAAEEIINNLIAVYGAHRDITVSVDEDGENGSTVMWEGENTKC